MKFRFMWWARDFVLGVLLTPWATETMRFAAANPSGDGVNDGDEHLRLDANREPMMEPWLDDMEPLPAQHAPSDAAWRNSLAVCAVMKDEQVDDVIEWLAYYRWLGAEHVFLTDNGSADFAALQLALWRHFPPSFLTLRQDATRRAQLKVYAWCAETQRARFNWLAFFDLDEFLAFPGSADPAAPPEMAALLDEFKEEAALSVNWVFVGPSGRETRPEEGGVLRWYDQCVTEVDARIKTIANTWFLAGLTPHPHNFVFRDGMISVDEHHEALSTHAWRRKRGLESCEDGPYTTDEKCINAAELPAEGHDAGFNDCCLAMAAASREEPSADRVALFHYATKSAQDFKAKQQRGSGMSGSSKADAYFAEIQQAQKRAPLCDVPGAAWDTCCSPEAMRKSSEADMTQYATAGAAQTG